MNGLEALREHHLVGARAHAAGLIADARALAQSILEKAQADAAHLTQQAEEDGHASAEQDTGRDWTAARRRARAIRLAAQRAVYEDVKAAAAKASESDPRSPGLVRQVAEAARTRLGPGALVTAGSHGVSATRGKTHVRWTVTEAVDESLSRLGPELEELWR